MKKKTKTSPVSMYRITPSYLRVLKAPILADLALLFFSAEDRRVNGKERGRKRRSIARPTKEASPRRVSSNSIVTR